MRIRYQKFKIKKFEKIMKKFRSYGVEPVYVHLQNSAGLMYDCSYCNAVRIGISIYGEKPSDSFDIPVKTVMSVRSKIITVKKLKKGQTVSYGGRFKAERDMKIGVVAFGYADGLPRELSNRGYFLINDKKVPILGTVTMDMTIVDLTHINDVKPMDVVTIVGKDNKNEIYFDDIAVDDEKNITDLLKDILEDEGFNVDVAFDISSAKDKIKEKDFDIVFLDVWLPDGEGTDLIPVIKENNQITKIIMISGHANIPVAVKALKEGAYDFLEKPISTESIFAVIEKAVKEIKKDL